LYRVGFEENNVTFDLLDYGNMSGKVKSKKESIKLYLPQLLRKLNNKVSYEEIEAKLQDEGITVSESILRKALRELAKDGIIEKENANHGKGLYWMD